MCGCGAVHVLPGVLKGVLPALGTALQSFQPELQPHLGAVAAAFDDTRAVRHHQFTVQRADRRQAPVGDVVGVAGQFTFGALCFSHAQAVHRAQAGLAVGGQHAFGGHPGVAEAGVGLGCGEPGGLEARRALLHDARRFDESLGAAQPQRFGILAIGRRPPHVAQAFAHGQRGIVQRPAVGPPAHRTLHQRLAQGGAAVGRVLPAVFQHAPQVVHMGHGRTRDGLQLLRALFGAAQHVAFGLVHTLPVLQRRQHRQQCQHRHHQHPHQPRRGVQRPRGRVGGHSMPIRQAPVDRQRAQQTPRTGFARPLASPPRGGAPQAPQGWIN